MGKKEELIEALNATPGGLTAAEIAEKFSTKYPGSIVKAARHDGYRIISKNGKYIIRKNKAVGERKSAVKILGVKPATNHNMLQRLGDNDRKMYFDYIQKACFYRSSADAMLSALETRIKLETEHPIAGGM